MQPAAVRPRIATCRCRAGRCLPGCAGTPLRMALRALAAVKYGTAPLHQVGTQSQHLRNRGRTTPVNHLQKCSANRQVAYAATAVSRLGRRTKSCAALEFPILG